MKDLLNRNLWQHTDVCTDTVVGCLLTLLLSPHSEVLRWECSPLQLQSLWPEESGLRCLYGNKLTGMVNMKVWKEPPSCGGLISHTQPCSFKSRIQAVNWNTSQQRRKNYNVKGHKLVREKSTALPLQEISGGHDWTSESNFSTSSTIIQLHLPICLTYVHDFTQISILNCKSLWRWGEVRCRLPFVQWYRQKIIFTWNKRVLSFYSWHHDFWKEILLFTFLKKIYFIDTLGTTRQALSNCIIFERLTWQ